MSETAADCTSNEMPPSRLMVAWNPETDQIKVGPYPDMTGWHQPYLHSDLGCWAAWHERDRAWRENTALLYAMRMILRDRMDPLVVHRELCKVPEYRGMLDWLGVTETGQRW